MLATQESIPALIKKKIVYTRPFGLHYMNIMLNRADFSKGIFTLDILM